LWLATVARRVAQRINAARFCFIFNASIESSGRGTEKKIIICLTAADSNEVSGSGIGDTSSIDKDMTAVVNFSFAVE
jgi:hypothetical protein